ncbi:ABC transporter ATP-binding protein [Campylobacter sp. VBCF_05 NA6]|uniref:ABC transporter ATP-binding protein n=1 Tax=unclassified Campylobacter TaxID=2593542 RepID=UPI0022E99BC5|nr:MULTISPECIES: ABC transporter ATP-binding protein [unclassified Campylobacter]MDA3057978.1 ABC transporter ATP-binding protein [Campylobacter sp. VBCF_04 NA7]MDA3059245.1 ABC transporter ATP-binding protein [Campylobacter sp. VBCF_05 NA6]
MSEFAIDVSELRKSFGGKEVIKNISLQVPRGKIYGFLGPNGSGKTTTIRLICGLLTPDSAKGQVLGYDVLTQSDKIREKVGYMTQKFSFWEDLTIRENLEFVAQIYQIPNSKTIIDETLANLGLIDRQNQLSRGLSGGWKQRLALSACILHKPEILLLDEPTAGVDPKARREFWDELGRLRDEGITTLVSTHYMDEAERCDELVYIANGKIVVKGTPKSVARQTGLFSFILGGINLANLAQILQNMDEITTTAMFGESLRICGEDEQRLEKILQTYKFKHELSWQKSEVLLEDAFVYYLKKALK